MKTTQKTVVFTGHRYLSLEETDRIVHTLDRLLPQKIACGAFCFRAGGALGFDTLTAKAVLNQKKKFPFVTLHLILPYPGQADGWNPEDRKEYESILAQADRITYVSASYYNGVLQARNRALVEGADICIAYLRSSHGGGAAYTSQLALRKGLEYLNLYDEIR